MFYVFTRGASKWDATNHRAFDVFNQAFVIEGIVSVRNLLFVRGCFLIWCNEKGLAVKGYDVE